MSGDKLFERWRRRYGRLLEHQRVLLRQCGRQGDAEAVHELRVTVRRLRLMVRLAAPFVGPRVADRCRVWSRSVSDATSRLRDLDVVLEWLQGRPEAAHLAERVARERARRLAQDRTRLPALPGRLFRRLQKFRTDAKARRAFARRYSDRFTRLFERMRPQARRYAAMPIEERHAFRRQLRQLRYLRELALPRRKQTQDPVLQLLVRPQVAMGEWQNLQLVESVLRELAAPREVADIARALAAEQARWDREIRSGLKAFAGRALARH